MACTTGMGGYFQESHLGPSYTAPRKAWPHSPMTIFFTRRRRAVSKWSRSTRAMTSKSPEYMAMLLLSHPSVAGMVQSMPAARKMIAMLPRSWARILGSGAMTEYMISAPSFSRGMRVSGTVIWASSSCHWRVSIHSSSWTHIWLEVTAWLFTVSCRYWGTTPSRWQMRRTTSNR